MHHHDYLFAFTTFKTGLITQEQFVMVMTYWLNEKSKPISSVIQELGVLSDEEIALIDGLVAKQLAKHGGNTQKCLSQLSALGDVESQLINLDDEELTHRIQSLNRVEEKNGDNTGVRYKRLQPHAKGALGEVFLAEDTELNRKVALKEIQSKALGEKSAISRFVREAEVTGQLEHPGIVPVYGLGFYDDGRPFYAMKFVRGDSLHEAIQQFHSSNEARQSFDLQNEPFRKLIQRLVDVCNAIHYAHSRGVLHRDLKPGNIMIGKYGETLVVDWGLARVTGQVDTLAPSEGGVIESADFMLETKAGSLLGTPQYMSPEQAQGKLDNMDATSDVYSLGATLYELLTGKVPLGKVSTLKKFIEKVTQGDFRSPKEISSKVPPELDAICRKAMSRKQSDRYQSAEELGEDLEQWLADQPVRAMRESLPMRARRWIRNHSSLSTAAAVFLVTSTIALGAGLLSVDELRRSANLARNRAANSEKEALKNLKLAQTNEEQARKNLLLVDKEREKEAAARKDAEQQRKRAQVNEQKALDNSKLAQMERQKAEKALEASIKSKEEAERQKLLAEAEKKKSELALKAEAAARVDADKQKKLAEKAANDARIAASKEMKARLDAIESLKQAERVGKLVTCLKKLYQSL